MQIGHRKEFLKSTFRSLDHPHSLWRWAKSIKTKLFCNGLCVILGYNQQIRVTRIKFKPTMKSPLAFSRAQGSFLLVLRVFVGFWLPAICVSSRSRQFLVRTKSSPWLPATCDLRFLALKTVFLLVLRIFLGFQLPAICVFSSSSQFLVCTKRSPWLPATCDQFSRCDYFGFGLTTSNLKALYSEPSKVQKRKK